MGTWSRILRVSVSLSPCLCCLAIKLFRHDLDVGQPRNLAKSVSVE